MDDILCDMEDHLKHAAWAAAMSDDELAQAHATITDPDNLTAQQQAVVDEMILRNFGTSATNQANGYTSQASAI
jgi:hypothetical protein